MSRDNWESSQSPLAGFSGWVRASAAVLEARSDAAPVQGVAGGIRSLRVLVVDDNRDAADSMAKLVQLWGHDVRVAYDGATALEAAAAYQPDVLVLDIAMPMVTGNDVARQLRRQTRFQDTLLIAISGYADEAHRLVSAMAGFDQYLSKPADPLVMEKMLRHERGRLVDEPVTVHATPRTNGILVVDDEEYLRGMLNAGMRQQGFAVWLAADGHEALALYRQQKKAIDVVLLDVRLPGLDGPQTLAALQQLNPRVRCCFMSGAVGDYTESSLRERGADAVFWKPFCLPEVALMLWELASRAKWNASLCERVATV